MIMMEAITWLVKPVYFFVCQITTWGECDLSDTALIYMNNHEASLWFLYEFIMIPFLVPEAYFWVTSLWWVYALQIFFWIVRRVAGLFFDDSGDDNYGEVNDEVDNYYMQKKMEQAKQEAKNEDVE